MADVAARTANSPIDRDCPVPWEDVRPALRSAMKVAWQEAWTSEVSNKLFSVSPLLNFKLPLSFCRQDAVVLTRLRIGHTFLTHSHLLKRENAPVCSVDSVPVSVSHILIFCSRYSQQRAQAFGHLHLSATPSISELLGPTVSNSVLSAIIKFLHLTGLYNLI